MKYKSLFRKILVVAIIIIGNNTCLAQGPVNIGTINPGDSIVVIYSVLIDDPLPGGTTQISNQGNVTGTNFPSPFDTDDPDSGTPDDATITLLNVYPLPVTFGGFSAYQKNNNIEVAWKILTEINTLKYEVEKSANGRTFTKIGEVGARGGTDILNYAFLDINPFTGNNYYRLRVIDNDGSEKFSGIVRVVINSNGQLIAAYPNPVTGHMINLQLTNVEKGRYQFVLYNNAGQMVYSKVIDHNGGSASEIIHIPASLSGGLYNAQLKNNGVMFNKILLVK